jgi:hypothetical protein
MAPRANWKGYLRLSLVSCPIALYPASSLREKVGFNRINRKTGNRLTTGRGFPRPATSSHGRTLREARRSAKANISLSKTRSSRPFRLKARAPSTSTSSFRRARSTRAISTRLTASRRTVRSDRMPLPSSVTHGQDEHGSARPRRAHPQGARHRARTKGSRPVGPDAALPL